MPRLSDPREQQLQQLIADAPNELTPKQDLWQGIAQRMDKPFPFDQAQTKQHPNSYHSNTRYPNSYYRHKRWAIAATVVLAIFVGFFKFTPEKALLNAFWQTQPRANQQQDDQQALHTLLAQIAQTHQAQVTTLESPTALVWQTSRFSAPLTQGLAELRLASQQIFQALQSNPTDKQLWQLWLWVQQRELDLLQQNQKLSIQHSTQGNSI